MRRLGTTSASLIALLSVSFTGCGLDNPGLPSWSIEVTIPFSQHTYRLSDLVTDSSKLAEQGWGILEGNTTLRFEYRDTLEYEDLGGKITYDESDHRTYRNSMGIVIIEEPPPDSATVPVTEILPDSIGPGYFGLIPPSIFQSVPLDFEFDVFRWAEVRAGFLRIKVKNTLPFSVHNLIFAVQNADDPDTISGLRMPDPIMPGKTVIDSAIIFDTFVTNRIRVLLNGATAGSSTPVSIQAFHDLEITASFSALTADRAYSEFFEQRFAAPDSHQINNRNRLIEAVVKKGSMFLLTSNTVPAKVTTTTVIENMIDRNNNVPTLTIVMEPGTIDLPSTDVNQIDLSGFKILMKLDDQKFFLLNTSFTEDTRITQFQDNTFQFMSREQGIEIEYWTGPLEFRSFTGLLDSVSVEIPRREKMLDLPQGLDSIQFTRDTLILNLWNESEMELLVDLQIQGLNTQHDSTRSVTLYINDVIHHGFNRLTIPDGDRLLTIVPDRIHVWGDAKSGAIYFPELRDRVISVREKDGFFGDFMLASDLKFVLGEMSILSDPVSLDTLKDYSVESLSLTINMLNSIPLGGNVKFLIGTDTTAMDTILSVMIPTGSLDTLHRVVEAAATTIVAFVGPETMDIIMQDSLITYTRQELNLHSSSGDTVWLYGADSLMIQATALVRYTIDFSDDDE